MEGLKSWNYIQYGFLTKLKRKGMGFKERKIKGEGHISSDLKRKKKDGFVVKFQTKKLRKIKTIKNEMFCPRLRSPDSFNN